MHSAAGGEGGKGETGQSDLDERQALLGDIVQTRTDSPRSASHRSVADLLRPEYWKSLCPALRLEETDLSGVQRFTFGAETVEEVRDRLLEEGIFEVPRQQLPWALEPLDVAEAIRSLVEHEWHPSFVWVFDELWVMAYQLGGLMASLGHAFVCDFFGWYVDPNRKGTGFPPHRDRAGGPSSFDSEGIPKYISYWTAFTDARADNGCLHFIPASQDAGYVQRAVSRSRRGETTTTAAQPKGGEEEAEEEAKEEEEEEQLEEPAATITADPRSIRAWPIGRGSVLGFSHRLLHWGGAASRFAPHPRIAMFFASSRPDFEAPYLTSPEHLPLPPLGVRLALAAGHRLWYSEKAPLGLATAELLLRLFEREKGAFHPSYVANVLAAPVLQRLRSFHGQQGAAPH